MRRALQWQLFTVVALLALLPLGAARSFDGPGPSADAQNNPASAQASGQPPAQAAQTFKSRTELVLVPVVVHDRHDAHIPGLSKNDFIVQENGADQKITVFEEVRTSGTPVHRASLPGVFTNALPRTGTQAANEATTPRLNIIVLDTINTPFLDQNRARQDLIKFLAKSVEHGELTSLLTLDRGGIHVVHDFTTDSAVLIAALQRVKGKIHAMSGEDTQAMNEGMVDPSAVQAEVGDLESFMRAADAQMARMQQQFSIQYTLDGFQTIARVFGGIPGRKALIWVTGSFPFLVQGPDDPPYARGFTDEMEHAFQLLNDANISVYPVDARGLVVGLPDASQNIRYNPRNPGGAVTASLNAHRATLDTMQSFAAETGGRAFYNTNDLEGAFQRAAYDSSQYYLLGYYRNTAQNKPGWRKLHVKVVKDGAHIRARTGYFVTDTPQKEDKTDFRLAVSSPMDYTGILFAVRWKQTEPGAADKKNVNFDVVVDHDALWIDDGDRNHMNFQVLALARTATGETAGQLMQTIDAHLKPESLQEIRSSGLGYHGRFEIAPGQYMVRFVIKDNLSGRIGTVSAPLTVD